MCGVKYTSSACTLLSKRQTTDTQDTSNSFSCAYRIVYSRHGFNSNKSLHLLSKQGTCVIVLVDPVI